MKSIDMTNVKEAGDFSRPAPGAYICGIYKVEDFADKEYLKVGIAFLLNMVVEDTPGVI